MTLLNTAPEKVNDAPYGDGWMLKIKMTQPADADLLLSSTDYDATL